jgi:hypothetical protein
LEQTKAPSCDSKNVAYRSAGFGNMRGKLPALCKFLLRRLTTLSRTVKKRQISVVKIGEYLTSQVCANCHRRSTKKVRERTKPGSQNAQKIHGVLKCQTCDTVWNQDAMAANNVWSVSLEMALNNANRPGPFKRQTNNAEDKKDIKLKTFEARPRS